MAESLASSGPKNSFSTYLLCGLGALSLFGSFAERDERGILFAQEPEVFAIAEVPEIDSGASGTPLVTGPLFTTRRPGQQRPTRQRSAQRQGFSNPPPVITPQTAAPGGSGPNTTPSLVENPANPINPGAVQNLVPVPTRNGLQSTTPLGQGTGPIGGFIIPAATDPADPGDPTVPDEPTPITPTVPAVPEPSSWLLMILGIGALGAGLRMKRSVDKEQKTVLAS